MEVFLPMKRLEIIGLALIATSLLLMGLAFDWGRLFGGRIIAAPTIETARESVGRSPSKDRHGYGVPQSISGDALSREAPVFQDGEAALARDGADQSESELYPLAKAISDKIRMARGDCRAVQSDLLGLLKKAHQTDRLSEWAMNQSIACLGTSSDADFLDALAGTRPDHPRVRERLGLRAYQDGDIREALHQLMPAAEALDRFESWETLADAHLSLAAELSVSGDRASAQEQLRLAEAAAQRALDRADATGAPFAMHTLARAALELGQIDSAIQWANRAIEALAGIPAGSRQIALIPEMHLYVGQIYFRAGQRDAGLAYMQQAIAMAQTPQQQVQLNRVRDRFLSDRN